MGMSLEGRRGLCVDITRDSASPGRALNGEERKALESFDLIYRTLCALMFNFVPTSGHPGGSVSSGRMVAGLLFDVMDYDLEAPDREDADIEEDFHRIHARVGRGEGERHHETEVP